MNTTQYESPDYTLQPLQQPGTVTSINDCSSTTALQRFKQLRNTLAPVRRNLLNHSVYVEVDSLKKLQEFMQMHVFAVWDFMSLVKRLQNELTCNSLPWIPSLNARIARFTNEVVLGEETDLGLDEAPISHFELYLRAMDEVGADTTQIRAFTAQLALGTHWEEAIQDISVAPGVRDFVTETLHCAMHGTIVEVAAFFFFGREDVIPEMFERLLRLWDNASQQVPHFSYYLRRHIELDGDSHGPWAQEMLTTLAGQRESNWQEATCAAHRAIASRVKLWDTVLAALQKFGGEPRLRSPSTNGSVREQ